MVTEELSSEAQSKKAAKKLAAKAEKAAKVNSSNFCVINFPIMFKLYSLES